MKKLAALLMLLCMLAVSVHAVADDYIGDMEVINCNEWVSLRETPNASSKRLVKVSLGAIVSNCELIDDEWIYAEYDGYSGYILAEYLTPAENRLTFNVMMVTMVDGAPFYTTIDAEEPVDTIPESAIVRNCSIMDNNRIYVEWNGRCGFISLFHAEVYNEMMHFPHQVLLTANLYGDQYDGPVPDLMIAHGDDFRVTAYDYNYCEFEDYLEADDVVPKLPFVLYSDETINHVHLFSIEMTDCDYETGNAVYTAVLEHIQYQVDPEHPLFVGAVIWGDSPNLAVGYQDSNGRYHFAFIELSGEDGSLHLDEF